MSEDCTEKTLKRVIEVYETVTEFENYSIQDLETVDNILENLDTMLTECYISSKIFPKELLTGKQLMITLKSRISTFCNVEKQHSHVPKLGNWEGEENVPYTAYFDKAWKGRTGPGGKMINPNDPQENPDLLNDMSAASSSPPRVKAEPERQQHHERVSREDIDQGQYANSPGHHGANQPGRGGLGPNSGETHRRTARPSAGSEQSIERSPLHRQARATGRDSPSWEGKSSYGSSHGTPRKIPS